MSDEKTNDLADLDPKVLSAPVTRFELWKAVMLLRNAMADVHIHDLADQVDDDEARRAASVGFKQTSVALQEFCDELIRSNSGKSK